MEGFKVIKCSASKQFANIKYIYFLNMQVLELHYKSNFSTQQLFKVYPKLFFIHDTEKITALLFFKKP